MNNTTKIRLNSLDIMRGLNLFLMLFVNDLFHDGVPHWLVHTKADDDGMGLADVVFPCFLFLVGLSIPFALSNRFQKESKFEISKHILVRTASLLIIGVFMVNADDYNQQLAGLNKYVWILAGYVSVFLVWNNYRSNQLGLKILGVAILLTLFVIYRAGSADNIEYIQTRWWGILGLIGWGYLVAALSYLFLRDNVWSIAITFLFFILLNCLSQLGLLSFLKPAGPFIGVIISGSVPSIVLGGLLLGVLLRKHSNEPTKFLKIAVSFGLICVLAGFVLRNWFIISKIKGTPSWGLICIGISTLVFAFIFYLTDVKKISKWGNVFVPAGKNSLTAYLSPDIIYYLIWSTGLHLFFYKQTGSQLLAVAGSLIWAFLMIKLVAFLVKKKIQLKL
jgi:heparan-alpha-glucosaminide N-acetyltransferase